MKLGAYIYIKSSVLENGNPIYDILPVNPCAQMHVYRRCPSLQDAPFLQLFPMQPS